MPAPVSSTFLRQRATELAGRHGWTLTVDALASAANATLPRFLARFAEPQAEAEVAFAVGDLGCPLCLACGQSHREVLFAFPPPNLLNRFVIKAQADGVRAVVITPLAVSAPYWTKPLRASVIPGPEGYERLRKQQNAPPDSDADGSWPSSLLISLPGTRLRTPSAPLCGQEAEFRGRCPSGSPADQAERASIHAHLDAVGLALRP